MTDSKNTPFFITICSGKGGVGKSILAANIAQKLAHYGKKVMIWDADMSFPNQHLLFGAEPPVRLVDVYLGKIHYSQALYSLGENIDLLADMPAAESNLNLDTDVLLDLYRQILADSNHDIVIIDTPAGASKGVLQCCNFADLATVVVTDEPTSLLDAYALIKLLLPLLGSKFINLFVNNVIDFEDAEEVNTKLNLATKEFLGMSIDLLGVVPYDRAVRQSILQQELLVNTDTVGEASKAIDAVAKNLVNKIYNAKIS